MTRVHLKKSSTIAMLKQPSMLALLGFVDCESVLGVFSVLGLLRMIDSLAMGSIKRTNKHHEKTEAGTSSLKPLEPMQLVGLTVRNPIYTEGR